MKILNVLLPLFLLAGSLAQTTGPTQTHNVSGTEPLQKINVQWVNGVAPGFWPTKSSGLTLAVGAGVVNCNGAYFNYSGGTLTATNNATSYAWLSPGAGCTPAITSSQPDCGQLAIAKITASGGQITDIVDLRQSAQYCLGGTAAKLVVLPSDIDFGTVQSGTTGDPAYLTLSNTGGQSLILNTPTFSGAPFSSPSISVCDGVIFGNSSCAFPATCSPTGTSTYTGTVTFTSSAADPQPDPVNLTCQGASGSTATLSLLSFGTGGGTISDGGSLRCHSRAGVQDPTGTNSVCSLGYPTSTSITLTPTPDADSVFSTFSGAGCAADCTFTLTATQNISATFNLKPSSVNLTLAGSGTGGGTMVSDALSPNGILNCRSLAGVTSSLGNQGCSGPFAQGTVVNVTATEDGSSTFGGWVGCPSGNSTSPCTITMGSPVTLTAIFNPTAPGLSLVQTATNCSVSGSTVACNWANAQNAGDTIILGLGVSDETTTISGIADTTGNTYTSTIGPTTGTGLRQWVYRAQNIGPAAAGANTTTATLSTSAGGVTIANLSKVQGGSGTSVASASVSPTGNRLELAVCDAILGSTNGPGAVASVTGNGLTWHNALSLDYSSIQGSARKGRIEVWYSMGSSPSTGAVTCTWATSPTRKAIIVSEATGTDTTGVDGAGAIGISASAIGSSGTLASATMGTFGSASNATYAAIGEGTVTSETMTAGTGMTLLGTNGANTDEWAAGNISPVTLNFTDSVSWGIIGIEIKAAGAAGRRDIRALEYSGLLTSGTPTDGSADDTGTSATAAPSSITTTVANDLITVFTLSDQSVASAATNFTQRVVNSFGDDGEDLRQAAATSYNPSVALTASGNWVSDQVAWKPGTGGGGGTGQVNVSLTSGNGTGSGVVVSNTGTPTLNCTITASGTTNVCSTVLTSGGNISLTATATSGSFDHWIGGTCGTNPVCSLSNVTTNQSLGVVFSLPTGGAVYYVATTGSDTSGTGTSSSPWASVSHAVDAADLTNGATINVAAGTYGQSVNCNGSALSMICIDRGGPSTTKRLIVQCSTQWSVPSSSGCLLRNASAVTGIGIPANNVDVSGFDIQGNQLNSQILVPCGATTGACPWGNSVHIYNNYVHDSSSTRTDTGGVTGCPSSGAIQFNNVHGPYQTDAQAIGNRVSTHGLQSLKGSCNLTHGIYADDPAPLIYNNIVSDEVGSGILLYSAPCKGNISNNVVTRSGISGINVGTAADCSPGGNVTINNNISDYNGTYGIQIGSGSVAPCGAANPISIRNNTLTGNTSGQILRTPSNTCSPDTGTTTETITTTFQSYVGTNSDDYHLKTGSAAIDGGTTICVTGGIVPCVPDIDFSRTTTRPQGAAIDRGAYER